MLAIRLTRRGAKKQPIYRVIVTEKETKRDGRFVEIVGHYNPCRQPSRPRPFAACCGDIRVRQLLQMYKPLKALLFRSSGR